MTTKQQDIEIVKMLADLGWSNPKIEYAGSGCNFKSTKTPYKFVYTGKDGNRYFRGAINGSIYYFLKWQFRTVDCGCDYGSVLKSNYGSSVKCTCPECGGYYKKNPKLSTLHEVK